MLTKNGAKLLDFGLARRAAEATPVADPEATTQTRPLTEEGAIVGTYQYMAPEQLDGQQAGGRTDIFALGALLYEMATGQPAFEGQSRTSLITAIKTSQPPPVSSISQTTPPAFDHVVCRCLEKDPDERWQSAHDVACELRWIGDVGSEAGVARSVAASRRVRRRTLIALAAAGWLIATALVVWLGVTILGSAPESAPRVRTYSWPVKDLQRLAASPDGRYLGYIADGYVHFRRFDEAEVRRLDDSRGAFVLAWSPDSSSIVYLTRRSTDGSRLAVPELRRVPAGGLSSTVISRVEGARSLWFGTRDVVYVASTQRRGGARILTVPVRGGEPAPYLETAAGEPEIRGGCGFLFLPDGETLVCVIVDEGRSSLALHRAGQGFRPLVTAPDNGDLCNPAYSTTGHLLYGQSDSQSASPAIWALPFDASRVAATGSPALVAPSAEWPSLTEDGSLYFSRILRAPGPERLVRVDREGRIVGAIGQPQPHLTSPALSPDGSVVAVRGNESDDTQDVWLHDVVRSVKTRLSFGVAHTWRPAWSPDGRRIAFHSRDHRDWLRSDLYVQDTDGRSPPEALVATDLDESGPHWSPDGRFILYTVEKEDTDQDLWFVAADGSAEPRPLLASRFRECMPFVSPDGRFVAYNSDRTGEWETFVTTFPEPSRERQISTNGGIWPQWGENEIYYVEADTESLMAVKVRTSPEFHAADPVRLFSEEDTDVIVFRSGTFDYAITSSADRFVFVQNLSPGDDDAIAVLQNWVEVLGSP